MSVGGLDLEVCGQVVTEGISRVVGWRTDGRTPCPVSLLNECCGTGGDSSVAARHSGHLGVRPTMKAQRMAR